MPVFRADFWRSYKKKYKTKEDLVGNFKQEANIYDKISTIMIRFDENTDIDDPYLKSLQTIFKKETTRQEKILL